MRFLFLLAVHEESYIFFSQRHSDTSQLNSTNFSFALLLTHAGSLWPDATCLTLKELLYESNVLETRLPL